jgi:hypothetical protein
LARELVLEENTAGRHIMLRAGLLVFAVVPAAALDVLVAEGNPHQKTCSDGEDGAQACMSCPAQSLPPDLFLPAPLALALNRQADTFLRVDEHKHAGVPVPVFHFKQPSRLSHLELPFGMALVSGVDERGLTELAVPPADASDSWFPDYAWSSVLVCAHGAESGLHLGWRYVRKPNAQGTGPTEFVALIVRPDKSAEAEADGRAKVGVGQELAVGIEAPSWMLAMAMATRVRSK